MDIFGFFTRRRNARLAAKMAADIAERSHKSVMDRVRRRASTMRISEARGYIRARALEIVHRELAVVHRGRITLDPALQTAIISQATEAVIVRVLAEVRSVPKASPRPSQAA